MDQKNFPEMKVAMPDYGNAPAELVAKHKELNSRMAELYESGEALSSPKMLELANQINELNHQILGYHTEK